MAECQSECKSARVNEPAQGHPISRPVIPCVRQGVRISDDDRGRANADKMIPENGLEAERKIFHVCVTPSITLNACPSPAVPFSAPSPPPSPRSPSPPSTAATSFRATTPRCAASTRVPLSPSAMESSPSPPTPPACRLFPSLTKPKCRSARNRNGAGTPHPTPQAKARPIYASTEFDTFGRKVGYPTSSDGQKQLFDWLRENPHRLHLGRIGFAIDKPEDDPLHPTDSRPVDRHSAQRVRMARAEDRGRDLLPPHRGHDRRHRARPHPGRVRVSLRLRRDERRRLDAPRQTQHAATGSHAPNVLDLDRTLDADRYTVSIAWPGIAAAMKREVRAPLRADSGERSPRLLLRLPALTAAPQATPSATFAAARKHWSAFWTPAPPSISPPLPTRAPANWNAASCSRNTSLPYSAPAPCRRRKPDSPATVGTASSTWRCTTGMPRTSPPGAARRSAGAQPRLVQRNSARRPRKGQTAGLRRRALAQDDRARRPRQPFAHRPAAHLAAAASHRHGRVDLRRAPRRATPWPATATSSSNPPISWRAIAHYDPEERRATCSVRR